MGLPAFGDLGDSQPSFIAPAAGVIRALDLGLNEYQTGAQDFVAAWDTSSGELRTGFPAPVNDLSFLTGPAVGDVGGTAGEEIVAGTSSMDLVALNGTGAPTSTAWPKLSSDWTIATPLLGSLGTLDTDPGAPRVVVNLTQSGYINAYATDAQACAPASSPRFHHDNANSGDYRRDAVLPGKPAGLVRDGDAFDFTAPGDDLLCGSAAAYEIVTSASPIDESNFDAATTLAGAPAPSEAGAAETYAVPGDAQRYVAVRAVDEQGNPGRVASLDYGGPPVPEPCGNVIVGTAAGEELTGTAGSDRIKGRGGDDRIKGLGENDCLKGGKGADAIGGGVGDDSILAGPGEDRLAGGAGDDEIAARKGRRDVVSCGAGEDVATIDRRDRVRQSCEQVDVG